MIELWHCFFHTPQFLRIMVFIRQLFHGRSQRACLLSRQSPSLWKKLIGERYFPAYSDVPTYNFQQVLRCYDKHPP